MVDIKFQKIEDIKLYANSTKNNLKLANYIKKENVGLKNYSDYYVLSLARLERILTNLSSLDEIEIETRRSEIKVRHDKITDYERQKVSEKDPKIQKQLSKLIEEESGKIKELQGQNADAEIKKIIIEEVLNEENLNDKKIHLTMQKINEQLKLKQYANRGFFKKVRWLYPAKNSHATSVKKIKQAYIKAYKLEELKKALTDNKEAKNVLEGLSNNEENNTQKIYLDDNSHQIIVEALKNPYEEAKEEENKYLEYSYKTSSMEFHPSMKKSDVIKDACANMGKDAEIKFTLGYSAMGPNEARLDNKALATLIQKRNEGYKLTIEQMEGLTDINIKENETAQQFIDKITSKSSTGIWKRFHNTKLIKGVKYLCGKNRTKTANNLLYNHLDSIRHDNKIALDKLFNDVDKKENPPEPQADQHQAKVSLQSNLLMDEADGLDQKPATPKPEPEPEITLTKNVYDCLKEYKYSEANSFILNANANANVTTNCINELLDTIERHQFVHSLEKLLDGESKDDILKTVNKGMQTFGKSQSAKFLNKDNAKNLQITHNKLREIGQNAGKNVMNLNKKVLNNKTSGEKQRPHGASAENSNADNQSQRQSIHK